MPDMKTIIEQLADIAGVNIQKEVSDYTGSYQMIQGGSPEIEVMEFLYSLVRLIKPKNILETGSYAGWSSAVMAYALVKNGQNGQLITLEILDEWVKATTDLHNKLGLSNTKCEKESSLEYKPPYMFDLMFLDSEPDIRFKELQKFYPFLNEGGYVMIHDLHNHLGLSNQTLHNMEHWPFGDFRPYFGDLIKNHELQVVNFMTPRGFTLFYKSRKDDSVYKLLKGEI